MTVDALRQFCLSFPQATESLQWGETLCFKVEGKLFALLGLDSVPVTLCVKASPEKFAELMEVEGIIPAPYLGRYKWVLLEDLDVLRPAELEELIGLSYELVVAKIPRKTKSTKKKAGKSKRTSALRKKH